MFSLRPAYPRSFYVFGALLTAVLLITSAVRPGPQPIDVAETTVQASSPQLLALELTR
ncbi:MAG: hypothetical protein Tsb0019_13940 [Roseibium sp.]